MKTLKQVEIIPLFVEYIPDKLEQGVVYISKQYNHSTHLCLCGCGEKTELPLNQYGWQLIEKNEKISFTPSIGNYQFECKSHYVIQNNKANFI